MIKYDFSGKTVIVTGAGAGIGKVTAIEFLKAGANVTFVSRTPRTELLEEIASYPKAFFVQADVSSEKDVNATVDTVVTKYGKIDILINNASVAKGSLLEETALEDWEGVMQNNVNSTFLCTKAVVKNMKTNRYGKIVNVSSVAGRDKSMILGASYSTSKAATIGFTRHMGTELAKFGINVNAVCPSQTHTPMLESLLTKEIEEMLLKKIPLGYIQEPIQVANVILFLSSDESNYMTGAIVDINGGLL